MQNMNFPTYVFATVNHGRVQQVVEELKRQSHIDLIAPVTGRYDLVLRLKPSAPEQILSIVKNIRQINGVMSTTTFLAFDGIQPIKRLEDNAALGISLLNVEQPFEAFTKRLSSIPGLVEAYTVPGQFDVVALWQARSADEIVKTSVEQLTGLQGISKSETLLAFQPFIKA